MCNKHENKKQSEVFERLRIVETWYIYSTVSRDEHSMWQIDAHQTINYQNDLAT